MMGVFATLTWPISLIRFGRSDIGSRALSGHKPVRGGFRLERVANFRLIEQMRRVCLLFIHPGASNLISLLVPAGTVPAWGGTSFVRSSSISSFKDRRELALDNVALRQQLAIYSAVR